jgi:hypothetical protein
MPHFRVTFVPTTATEDRPIQFFSPTLAQAKSELKRWIDKLGPGKYKIVEVVDTVVEEGEC